MGDRLFARHLPDLPDGLRHGSEVDGHVGAVGDDVETDLHPFARLLDAARLDARPDAVLPADVDDPLQRIEEPLIAEPAGDAHGLREIEVTDPEYIHARCRRDGLRVLHTFDALDLADDGRVPVR